MIAALGMYDMPPLHRANDRFWSAIRTRLGHGPAALTRDADPWDIWRSPRLVLAQTCGMPFRTRLHDQVALVGTPDYGLSDCPRGHYRSVLVARAVDRRCVETDFADGTFAYNEALSQSGWAGPTTHFETVGLRMAHCIETGSHVASARAVANGHADLAGLDALTWELLREHDPVASRLKVIARTSPTPGLPYITAPGNDTALIAAAIRAAISDIGAQDRATLHITGLIDIPKAAYLSVPTPPGP